MKNSIWHSRQRYTKNFSSLISTLGSSNSNPIIQRKTIIAIEEARGALDSGNVANPGAAHRLIDEGGGVIAGYLDRQASVTVDKSRSSSKTYRNKSFIFLSDDLSSLSTKIR